MYESEMEVCRAREGARDDCIEIGTLVHECNENELIYITTAVYASKYVTDYECGYRPTGCRGFTLSI